jgi:hypothetical protein
MATKTLQAPVQPVLVRPIPTLEREVPQSFFIDHVGPRLVVDWAKICGQYSGGVYEVPLDPVTKASFLDVTQFRRISVYVSDTKAKVGLCIGKWSGSTAAERFEVPADGKIHSFEVIGPQMHLELDGGATYGVENVALWVYLRS